MNFRRLAALLLLCTAAAAAPPKPAQRPAPGPLHIIGGETAGGCIAGAVRLPAEGPGFQTIHLDRSSFWGAPESIAGIERLGREASAAGLPTLLVEDIGHPRGGPLPGGHVAHQIGLDVDIGLDMGPRPPIPPADLNSVVLDSLVRADQRDVAPEVWSAREVTLLHLAADLPDIDRILVNPAIKQQLCREVTGERTWLRRIRPWYGHEAHMHMHFRCPEGQLDCVQQAPPPAGDGCDATLQWWFTQLNAPPEPAKPAHLPPPPPAACKPILAGD